MSPWTFLCLTYTMQEHPPVNPDNTTQSQSYTQYHMIYLHHSILIIPNDIIVPHCIPLSEHIPLYPISHMRVWFLKWETFIITCEGECFHGEQQRLSVWSQSLRKLTDHWPSVCCSGIQMGLSRLSCCCMAKAFVVLLQELQHCQAQLSQSWPDEWVVISQ